MHATIAQIQAIAKAGVEYRERSGCLVRKGDSFFILLESLPILALQSRATLPELRQPLWLRQMPSSRLDDSAVFEDTMVSENSRKWSFKPFCRRVRAESAPRWEIEKDGFR